MDFVRTEAKGYFSPGVVFAKAFPIANSGDGGRVQVASEVSLGSAKQWIRGRGRGGVRTGKRTGKSIRLRLSKLPFCFLPLCQCFCAIRRCNSHIFSEANWGQKSTTKKLCDKDFTERSGELSGAICLKTLVLLEHDR